MKEKEKENRKIIERVEEELNYHFDDRERADIFKYTLRKCEVNGKDDDYVPILYETELRDHVMRSAVNTIGYFNFLRKD